MDVHEAAQAALGGTMAVGAAEGVVAGVRQVELAGEQQAARRRLAAARGRLTRARRDGSAAGIAAAAARVDAANAEFDTVSERVIGEMLQLTRARHEHLDQVFAGIDRSWTAGAAVLDALAHPAVSGPARERRGRRRRRGRRAVTDLEAVEDPLSAEPVQLTGALVGYARVSTSGQLLDRQTRALTEAGCIRVFADKLSGRTADRPELAACLQYLRPGDTLVVPSLDRLSRSLQDLISLVAELRRRGAGFRSLHEALDTTTPGGRLVFHVFAALAEFIRELIVEGTREGLEAARARGQRLGRPPALTAEQVGHARQLLTEPTNTVSSIARLLGVSRSTIYAHVPELAGRPSLPASTATAAGTAVAGSARSRVGRRHGQGDGVMAGRPVEPASIERTAWPELPQQTHRRDAAALKAARAARLAVEVTVRVRCTGGRLHAIRLTGGRLQLLDHSGTDRNGWYASELPRCLQVLQVWRAAGQPGYGHPVRGSDGPDRWKIHAGALPPALRRAREQAVADGQLRAGRRGWLGMPALAADNAAGALVVRLLVREYGRLARPRLLLDRPVAELRVSALPAHGPARAHGVAFRDPDPNTGEDRGGYLAVHIRHDWLRTLWWRGRGVVDGRTVLDVDHDRMTGVLQAWLVDWAAPDWRLNSTNTTTVPGELGVLAVPLLHDGGRWHLVDPDAGTTLRPAPVRR